MWPRIFELVIGCWLAMSPFIFRHSASEQSLWVNDLLVALIIIVLALLSFWPPLRHAHLLNIGSALWLIAFGYFSQTQPVPPTLQNDVLVGWLLQMFVILPNEANLPPRSWRAFYAADEESQTQER